MNNKRKFLLVLLASIILLLGSVYYGAVVRTLTGFYSEFDPAELPVQTILLMKFWWVPIVFFSGTTVWSALKYKDISKK
jgi:hypothetical protein